MPSLQLMYADGTELLPLPVEIWANNEPVVTKVIAAALFVDPLIPHGQQMRLRTTISPVYKRSPSPVPTTIAAQCRPSHERGRRDSLAGVEAIAKLFTVGCLKGCRANEAATALLNQAVANALDAFQQPFTVELSGEAWTESSDAPLAYVTSVGFDGKPRTNDDLAWRELDGTVSGERQRADLIPAY